MNGSTKQGISAWGLRLIGLVLLIVLLIRLDTKRIVEVFRHADTLLIVVALMLTFPLILIKTIRWTSILGVQGISYRLWPAFLAYFGSIFIGFLTPGRLGEFIKAVHVSRECNVSSAQAFSGVLGDRLFDLYLLVIMGTVAVFSLSMTSHDVFTLCGVLVVLTAPLVFFLNSWCFAKIINIGNRFGPFGRKMFAQGSWVVEMRAGLRQLNWKASMTAIGLTVIAFALLIWQSYLLSIALQMHIGLLTVSYAMSIGSLVTLVPISISGLGTREASMILYLGNMGVPHETAMAFSLLVFVVGYIGSGVIGAVAWWLKPIPAKLMHPST